MTAHPDARALVELHALDALEPDERRVIERALADNESLRRELDGHRAVAAVLAEAIETAPSTPSPAVWERISAEITGTSDRAMPRLASATEVRSHRRWTRTAALVSAAAVIVSLALGWRVLSLQDQIGRHSIDDLAADAVTAPGSILLTLEPQEGHGNAGARIVLATDGTGYLLADNLPALAPDRTYQLWAIVAAGEERRVISAGVLGPDPGVSQFSADGIIAGFAITEEVAGGVVVSEGETVAVGLIDL